MRISVVIPVHNAEPYLAQTLGSALDQAHPPVEIIVVDDASTDGGVALAGRFAEAEPTVRLVSSGAGHASRARNLGAQLATGDAIMFLDADDVLAPDALSALAAALSQAPYGLAVCPWFRLALADGRWVQQPPSCPPRRAGQDALAGWLTGWYHPPCAMLWSRSAFEHAGRWDELAAVNQDGDLVMRALAIGRPLAEATEGAAFYRRTPGGSMSGRRLQEAGLESRRRTLEKIQAWLRDAGTLDKYRAPLSEAFARVAADAGAVPAAVPSRPAGAGREVRHGLDRAQAVLDRAPLGSSAPALEPTQPAVTVIIPTYNRAPLLQRAMHSVLGQSFANLELIVVDDGSTDETDAVIAACGDPRVRHIRQDPRTGVAAARNRGLREARGEFIAFLDSDDEWAADKLERQLERFNTSDDSPGLVYSGVETVGPAGTRGTARPVARGHVYREMLHHNVIHGGGSNAMIRRAVVATAGFFNEDLPAIEDYEYWIRVARFFAVDAVDAPLVRYHDPAGDDRRSRRITDNLRAREWLFRRHRDEMRRLRVAHLFLLKTARWTLNAGHEHRGTALRLIARALVEAPASRTGWRIAARLLSRRRAATPSTRRLRVLLYSSVLPDHRGGVQAVIRQVGNHLRARGHTVVVAWSRPGATGQLERVYPLPAMEWRGWVPAPRAAVQSVLAMLRLTAALTVGRFDVVNYHYATADARWFGWFSRLFAYRFVLSVHGSDVLRPNPDNAAVLERVLDLADAVTTVSEATRAAVRAAGAGDERLVLIPNGVDLDFWRKPVAPLRATQPDTILAVGRLHPVKGHDVLLRAMPSVTRQIPSVRLVIVGEGGFRPSLEELAAELGIHHLVELPGELPADEVRRRMWLSALFVLPSRSEGMPLTLLEAMACGLPVVASAVGAVPALLADGAGRLVAPESPDALAEALVGGLRPAANDAAMVPLAASRTASFSARDSAAAYEALFAAVTRRSQPFRGEHPEMPAGLGPSGRH